MICDLLYDYFRPILIGRFRNESENQELLDSGLNSVDPLAKGNEHCQCYVFIVIK